MKWGYPASPAQVANTLAAEFVQERRELVGSQADSAIAELTRQLPQAEERMHVAGERLWICAG